MTVTLSCAFPPVPDTPAHIELAEQLGFHTAWVYDTPALQLDCWMTLALAALGKATLKMLEHVDDERSGDGD